MLFDYSWLFGLFAAAYFGQQTHEKYRKKWLTALVVVFFCISSYGAYHNEIRRHAQEQEQEQNRKGEPGRE